MLEGQELDALKADMEANAQINKIVLYQGKILDGRNRYKVCTILGIEPETIEYTGDDPLGLVLSLNLHRRHLNESQRSIIAAKIANLTHGGDRKSTDFQVANLQLENSVQEKDSPTHSWANPKEPEPVSQKEAAKRLNVSPRSVSDAVKVVIGLFAARPHPTRHRISHHRKVARNSTGYNRRKFGTCPDWLQTHPAFFVALRVSPRCSRFFPSYHVSRSSDVKVFGITIDKVNGIELKYLACPDKVLEIATHSTTLSVCLQAG
jgi:hypothetical protein